MRRAHLTGAQCTSTQSTPAVGNGGAGGMEHMWITVLLPPPNSEFAVWTPIHPAQHLSRWTKWSGPIVMTWTWSGCSYLCVHATSCCACFCWAYNKKKTSVQWQYWFVFMYAVAQSLFTKLDKGTLFVWRHNWDSHCRCLSSKHDY